ncbi:hypothetical protein Nepgr_029723 [Nepenthes gracilis]|uniref:Uncharacterized protein n=1 Tax=Nepenthes gracilis TaxID=150966 RepID=A0AAD3TE43_NEPGR|nr:hypothetical protein Nepgr_029723 [Nepenthes gracilis]
MGAMLDTRWSVGEVPKVECSHLRRSRAALECKPESNQFDGLQFDGGAVPSKAYDMETLGRAQLARDHQLLLSDQIVPVCRESTTRDLASLEAVHRQELSPTTEKSSLAQLSPDGMVATLGNLELLAQAMADLPLGLDCRFPKASWLSLARDLVSLEAIDQLLLSPSSAILSSA